VRRLGKPAEPLLCDALSQLAQMHQKCDRLDDAITTQASPEHKAVGHSWYSRVLIGTHPHSGSSVRMVRRVLRQPEPMACMPQANIHRTTFRRRLGLCARAEVLLAAWYSRERWST
jgi:hypothetical protein